jgi:ribosome-binding protein aMBF1 (putative translation factor)
MTYMTYNDVMKFYDSNELLKVDLKDPEFKKEWDALEVEFNLIHDILRLRIKHDISQEELARKMKSDQATISRLESGNYNPSIGFLKRLAKALGSKLIVSLQ